MSTPSEDISLELDKDGFLVDLTTWSEAVALQLARREQVELDERHWRIIFLLRDYYQRYESAPAMRPLIKFLRQECEDLSISSTYLLTLFPNSPAMLAAKIAGLPRPENCL